MANTRVVAKNAHIPEFKVVHLYSFRAEWDVIHDDIVVHFYLPKQAKKSENKPREVEQWMKYWLDKFPVHLSEVAKREFKADYPRLVAKYTEEQTSWFFKAHGFGTELLDPGQFLEKFFQALNESLQSTAA